MSYVILLNLLPIVDSVIFIFVNKDFIVIDVCRGGSCSSRLGSSLGFGRRNHVLLGWVISSEVSCLVDDLLFVSVVFRFLSSQVSSRLCPLIDYFLGICRRYYTLPCFDLAYRYLLWLCLWKLFSRVSIAFRSVAFCPFEVDSGLFSLLLSLLLFILGHSFSSSLTLC